MKTILVIAQHPDFSGEIRRALDAGEYRVIQRATVVEAEPLLVHGMADACICDLDLTTVEPIWALEKIRRFSPRCPVILYAGARQSAWEEEAYLKGAAHVLAKPVRARTLSALLARLWSEPSPGATPYPFSKTEMIRAASEPPPAAMQSTAQTLSVLRNFSSILTHSLDAEGILRQFLLLLREILSINRAAIFLRQPLVALDDGAADVGVKFVPAASVGLSTGLLQHLKLSFEAGIGAHLAKSGKILRRDSEPAHADLEVQKEFEILGGQVAVPILDRESIVGIAVFDGRITGESLLNSELQLVFHLLEQLGLAVKNIGLHDQLAANHELMAGIMRELSSACVVVNAKLCVLHANKMARRFFLRESSRTTDMEFSDLPQVLGARIYQVLNTGSALSSFRYEPEDAPGTVYSVSVVPFQRQPGGLPSSVLMVADDLTQAEHYKRLEIEAANNRQLKSMADRLTAELGNAATRLSTYQQLLSEKLGKKSVDLEFLKLMEHDWADDMKRITRFVSQLRYLNVDSVVTAETFPLEAVLEEAFQEARKYQPAKSSNLTVESPVKELTFKGDRAALKLAFTEILLNALQANPAEPRLCVRLRSEANGAGPALLIEVQDNGPGFSPDVREKASQPFYTTRVVGLGLGLTVSRKIIETHQGKLEILPAGTSPAGLIRIMLPEQT